MDKQFIKQYDSEIFCYQIKTARQKKRAVKTAEEKNLLQLHREQKQLRLQQRNLGYVELHPPIVKGWKRYFILREDVARSSEALFYQQILDKINTVEYCKRKDFKRKNAKRKTWEQIDQTVLQPEHSDFVKLNFTEKEKVLFEERFVKHKWRNVLVKVFVFKEQWRFVFRVRQNIITKLKVVDVDLEKREHEIRDYLESTNKRDKLSRLLGHNVSKWRRWDNQPKAKYRWEKRNLIEILEEIKNNS